jgi:hypothetical protein
MPEHTETLQSLAFDGVLSLWQGVLVGGLLAALAFWNLFRVPSDARRRIAPVLWLLRVSAIALVVWMLLGPVRQTIVRRTIPKSFAVITDVSHSMDAVDPPDKKADIHWAAATGADSASALLASCDKALAAAAMARDDLQWLLKNQANGQAGAPQPERTRAKVAAAGRAASTAVTLTQTVVHLLEEGRDAVGSDLIARGKDIAAALVAARVDQIAALLSSDESRPILLDRSAIDALEEWQTQLSRGVRALGQLSDRIAERLVETKAGSSSAAGRSGTAIARRDKVDQLLKAAEKSWSSNREEKPRIRHYTFDRDVRVVNNDEASGTSDRKEQNSKATPSAPKTNPAGKTPVPVTNLSSPLERVNRDSGEQGIQAVLLLSDGRHNDPAAEDPRLAAKSLGDIPVYVLPIGTSQMQRDVILHHLEPPIAVVEGDQIVVEAIVSAYECAGEKLVVELSEANSVIDRQEIDVPSVRRDSRIRLTTPAKKVGRHEFALAVKPIKGEASDANNSATFGVDVIDATLRILAADSVPRWEFRYLIRLFERDKRITFDEVLFEPSPKGAAELGPEVQLPHDLEGWSRYRLAILGDLSPAQLDEQSQRSLREYLVDRGGTVIVIAGTQSMPQAFAGMPLSDLIPVSTSSQIDPSQGYELSLSAEGRMNPAMQLADQPDATNQVWKDMSRQLPIYGLSSYCIPKPAARTLISASPATGTDADTGDKAFLCWQSVGRGRVVYVSAPAVYQLRMKFGDRYHYRFWGQLLRWAVARDLSQGSKTVKLSTDRSRASVGENLQVVANLSDPDGRPVSNAEMRVQASIDGNALSLIPLAADPKIPGRYLGELTPTEEGTLLLQAMGADVTQLLEREGIKNPITTSITVDPMQSVETEDTRANIPLLNQIARLTGGQVVAPAAVSQLVDLLDLDPSVHEETRRSPLWNRWSFLSLICGVLAVEWSLRKLTGLP